MVFIVPDECSGNIRASHLNTMISSELGMNRIDSSLFSQKTWTIRDGFSVKKSGQGMRINERGLYQKSVCICDCHELFEVSAFLKQPPCKALDDGKVEGTSRSVRVTSSAKLSCYQVAYRGD